MRMGCDADYTDSDRRQLTAIRAKCMDSSGIWSARQFSNTCIFTSLRSNKLQFVYALYRFTQLY